MGSYLMMLYVTVDQEMALKSYFTDQGWPFKKPDLSVTTEEIGGMVKSNIDTIPSVTLLRAVRPSDRKRKAGGTVTLSAAPVVKHAKLISSPLSKTTLVKQEIVDNDADNDGDNDDDYTGEMDTDLDDHSYLGSAVSKSASQTTESEKADSSSAVTVRVNLDGTEAVDEIIQPEPPALRPIKSRPMRNEKGHYWVCDICGIKLGRLVSYNRHRRWHFDSERKHPCTHPGCPLKFFEDSDLKRHMRTHKPKVRCDYCGKNVPDLEKHYAGCKRFLKTQSLFSCRGCKNLFNSQALLNDHMTACERVRSYQCHKCGLSCSTENGLKTHLECHNTKREKLLCEVCSKEFLNKMALKRHGFSHQPDMECKYCNELVPGGFHEVYKCSARNKNHPLSCPVCNVAISGGNAAILRHLKRKHPEYAESFREGAGLRKESEGFPCSECGRKFKDYLKHENHEKRCVKNSPYECGFCKQHFKTLGQAKAHVDTCSENYPNTSTNESLIVDGTVSTNDYDTINDSVLYSSPY
ncbi:zinc finger protein 555-like isoform X4 [Mya arenaria]|uniref:zinc finger protein 555-like isoform X4 n=1 Tax=Mya arenaria TaxID=6604 RepID=UPI0022E22DD3|nr:zinc finger protein 555-like isoform X4 [Mya arenaria]